MKLGMLRPQYFNFTSTEVQANRKEMLCFVEALIEISVSKSLNNHKSLANLAEEASSANAVRACVYEKVRKHIMASIWE